ATPTPGPLALSDTDPLHCTYSAGTAIGPPCRWLMVRAWNDSGCFRDLDAPYLSGAAGDHHDALPLPDLIDRPGIGLALVIGVGIFPSRREVNGFRESFIQDFVEEALGRQALAFQRHRGEQCEDVFRALKSDRFHRRADSSESMMSMQWRTP